MSVTAPSAAPSVSDADIDRFFQNPQIPPKRPGEFSVLYLLRRDVITCMEVLEHCLEPERLRVLDELAGLARPAGRVVISVPIEIGPSLAAKQLARALAGLRGLGDYEREASDRSVWG